jgi:phosphotransferase system enzyme I (PtsP)
MLPMVSNLGELDEAKEFIHRAHRELVEEGADIELPPIGVMVEVPAAVYQARAFARRSDFLSVGSNDLTQYLLAVDRNNARVADLYHAYHPSVLQALIQVAEAARAEGKQISICGELAGDPGAAVLLLAMGYDVLSMNATNLTKVKKALRNIRYDEATQILSEVLELETSDEVQGRLEQFLVDKGMAAFIHARLD